MQSAEERRRAVLSFPPTKPASLVHFLNTVMQEASMSVSLLSNVERAAYCATASLIHIIAACNVRAPSAPPASMQDALTLAPKGAHDARFTSAKWRRRKISSAASSRRSHAQRLLAALKRSVLSRLSSAASSRGSQALRSFSPFSPISTLRKLTVIELCVEPFLFQQLFMGALFDYAAVLHHKYHVRVTDS